MKHITVLCVGWQEDDLTLGAVKYLRKGEKIVLRTERCGCAQWLKNEKIAYETLDDLFESSEDFDELTELTVDKIVGLAASEPVIYCVNDSSDKTLSAIIQKAGKEVTFIPGVSEGSKLLPFAGADIRIVSAADADAFVPDSHVATLVRELDSMVLASEMKLKLSERYPDEHEIIVCDADGKISSLPLCDLDRLEQYDHRLCAMVPEISDLARLERYDLQHLEEIMRRLRDYDGCPWDRKQTHESLKPYLIEEAYEVADAIRRDDMDSLYDELGDVLFQVVFHAEIARQYSEFDMMDVTTAVCRKMLRRHPHVFGDTKAVSAEETDKIWAETKKQEKTEAGIQETICDIPGSFPALMRARKILKKLSQKGCMIPGVQDAFEVWRKTPDTHTIGMLLAALVREAGALGLEPESALNEYLNDYIRSYEEPKSSD